MNGMTKQQQAVAQFAGEYYKARKEVVTAELLAEKFGLKPRTAANYMRWLRSSGRIYPTPNFGLPRISEDAPKERKVVFNQLAMSIPLYSAEDLLNGVVRDADDPEHSLIIPRNSVKECKDLFAFEMNDDSFFDIGIANGDKLTFACDHTPGFGDLVLAIVPKRQLRLMRFFCDAHGRYTLKECRKSDVSFVYNDDCTILGTLMLAIRKYF